MIRLIGPITQLLTLDKFPLKGALKDEQLEILDYAGILMEGEKILEIGNFNDLKAKAKSLNTEVIELEKDYVALPGWIDCHTHICFGGTRARITPIEMPEKPIWRSPRRAVAFGTL